MGKSTITAQYTQNVYLLYVLRKHWKYFKQNLILKYKYYDNPVISPLLINTNSAFSYEHIFTLNNTH